MEDINESISIIRLLKQLMNSIKQNMEKEFRQMNLTRPQGMLMGILAHYGEMKISDLSDKLSLSNSTVSGIIDRLESQGYVCRIRSTDDRRVVHVRVTDEFKKKAENHFCRIEKKLETMMNTATPDEIKKIYEGMETLKELLEREKI